MEVVKENQEQEEKDLFPRTFAKSLRSVFVGEGPNGQPSGYGLLDLKDANKTFNKWATKNIKKLDKYIVNLEKRSQALIPNWKELGLQDNLDIYSAAENKIFIENAKKDEEGNPVPDQTNAYGVKIEDTETFEKQLEALREANPKIKEQLEKYQQGYKKLMTEEVDITAVNEADLYFLLEDDVPDSLTGRMRLPIDFLIHDKPMKGISLTKYI